MSTPVLEPLGALRVEAEVPIEAVRRVPKVRALVGGGQDARMGGQAAVQIGRAALGHAEDVRIRQAAKAACSIGRRGRGAARSMHSPGGARGVGGASPAGVGKSPVKRSWQNAATIGKQTRRLLSHKIVGGARARTPRNIGG